MNEPSPRYRMPARPSLLDLRGLAPNLRLARTPVVPSEGRFRRPEGAVHAIERYGSRIYHSDESRFVGRDYVVLQEADSIGPVSILDSFKREINCRVVNLAGRPST